jgi:hypothetical protein
MEPFDTVIDTGSGKIYWSEWGREEGIKSANLNGTGIPRHYIAGSWNSAPRFLSLDHIGGKIYWTNNNGKILRANLNGSSSEELVDILFSSPQGIAIGPSLAVPEPATLGLLLTGGLVLLGRKSEI